MNKLLKKCFLTNVKLFPFFILKYFFFKLTDRIKSRLKRILPMSDLLMNVSLSPRQTENRFYEADFFLIPGIVISWYRYEAVSKNHVWSGI